MIVQKLIDKIEKLQIQYKSVFDKYENPLIGLITYGWYFSDSFRLFQDIDVHWENCANIVLMSEIAEKIQEFETSTAADSTFEMSVCSWYQPYHYTPRTKWGMHIRYRCLGTLSARFNNECPNLIGNPPDSVKASFFYFYIHELFHHLVENAVSVVEVEHGDPSLYNKYLSDVYNENFNTSNCLEESLANSYLFERNALCHIDKDYLKKELLSQGEGYNSFINYIGSKFGSGLQKLISDIAKGPFDPPSNFDKYNSFLSEFLNISCIPSIPIWVHKMPLRTYGNSRTLT